MDNDHYPHAALLIDRTSLQVYKPTGLFGESKAFFDGKNYIYALKKEVAVSASPSYFALFSQKATAGAAHDYSIHKKAAISYAPYLQKTPDEKNHPKLVNDQANNSWSALLDKGFVGPAMDTPGVRRICPKKNATGFDVTLNEEISKMRVYVECFFGRTKKLWEICNKVYRYDLSHFDDDIDLCFLLTNENIEQSELAEKDQQFYWLRINQTREKEIAKELKRKTQKKNYLQKSIYY